jgi:hypothetical protein
MEPDEIPEEEKPYLFKIYVLSTVVGTITGLTIAYCLVAFIESLFKN